MSHNSVPSMLIVSIRFIRQIWGKLPVIAIAIVLSSFTYAERTKPMAASTLDYMSAFRYVAAWASKVNGNTSELTRNPHDFHGTVGSLDFFYSEEDHALRVWSFVSDSAGPLLTRRAEIKSRLDQVAQQHPEETENGVFDIRTLAWNRQAWPELEPCLWLRLDVLDSTISPQDMTKKLDKFSTTGYVWNRHKLAAVQREYWNAHPKPTAK